MRNYQIIGYDLNDQFVQISYQDQNMQESETLYLLEDKNGTELSLLMTYDGEKEAWIMPTDGSNFSYWANTQVIRNLLSASIDDEEIEYSQGTVKASELLYQFIRESLTKIYKPEHSSDRDTYIVFTINSITEESISLLQGIAERLNFDKDKVFVQDYKESFYDYVWSQPKEISNYDVVLFGFEKHNMYAYKFSKGQVAGTRRRDFVSISEDVIENVTFDKSGDRQFEKFARSFFGRSLVSSVFLVGKEFDEKWYDGALPFICNGRHVFQGKNLYSKGACFAAFRKSGITSTSLIYIDEFKTSSRILIKVNNKGNEDWYPILKYGENWYEVNHYVEVLVDQVTNIHIRIETIGSNMPREEIVPLDGLFDKQRRTCRLVIKIVMYSKDMCKIVIDDVDFGEIMKASGYHMEHMLSLEDYDNY